MLNKNLIWGIIVFAGLLVGGFFIFRYFIPNEIAPNNNSTELSELNENLSPGLVVTEVDIKEKKDLTTEIGQMLMIGFRGFTADKDSYIAQVIKDTGIGGVVLFDYDVPTKKAERNIENPEQVKQLIVDLQSFSETQLFVAVDAEGGSVNRLKQEYGFIAIPSAEEMGKKDFGETEKTASLLGKQLKELGFNMNMAPVVDINVNPDNPIIGKLGRAFSEDAMQVTWHSKAFSDGLSSNGIIPVIKHFPGHGSSVGDSHKGLVDVTETYGDVELFPYHLLQGQNTIYAVMTAHIVNKNIDKDYPATLSSAFINDILRLQVGFNGVVISDDMQMKAITDEYGLEDAIVRAVNAGVDIILLSNNATDEYDEQLPYKAYEIIEKAVADGGISEERILEASVRINNLKKQFEIVTSKVDY